jgi:hypothetical protein
LIPAQASAGLGIPDPAPLGFDLVAVAPDEFADKGFAHRHHVFLREASIEDLCNGAGGTGFGQERLEADDFLPHPRRLRGRADECAPF